MAYATIQDLIELWRPLKPDEISRATKLLEVVADCLRQEAINIGTNLDTLIYQEKILPNVLKSVIVDIVARTLMTSTDSEPMTQYSQSALGYSVSGTYLIPGGGLFIKKSELARLGLTKKQVIWSMEMC